MRVLHLAHASPLLGDRGGTELYADALVRAQGSTLLVPDPRPEAPPGLRRLDAHVFAVGMAPPTDFRHTWARPELAAALRQLPADLLHVHHLAHGDLQLPATCGVPSVITLHDYHLVCARGQLVDAQLQPCPGPELERCARCMGPHLRLRPGLSALSALSRRLGLHERARSQAARLPVDAAMKERMKARLQAGRTALGSARIRLSPSRDLAHRVTSLTGLPVEVIGLPLVAPVHPAPDPGQGPLRVLYLGALLPTKGVHLLRQAMEGLDATLEVWGPAPVHDADPGYGQREIQALGPAYRGVFDAARRQEILDRHDLLVVPSTWEENSPLVVREALAAGLRVLASDRGGIHEIDPRIQGFPAGELPALREALRREVRTGRGRWTPRDFGMDAHLEALQAHYQRALSGPAVE